MIFNQLTGQMMSFFVTYTSIISSLHIFTRCILPYHILFATQVIWNGAFATALASAAMAYGQRKVSPTLANIVYSTQPCFAALFSYLLLGESMGKPTMFGSSLLLAAVLFSMLGGEDNTNDQNTDSTTVDS